MVGHQKRQVQALALDGQPLILRAPPSPRNAPVVTHERNRDSTKKTAAHWLAKMCYATDYKLGLRPIRSQQIDWKQM